MEELKLGNVMIDCPDGELLADFYAALLGWQRLVLYNCPAVRSETGVVFLFAQEEDYTPPTWPEIPGKQQKQLHFDFQVPDVMAAVGPCNFTGRHKNRRPIWRRSLCHNAGPCRSPVLPLQARVAAVTPWW